MYCCMKCWPVVHLSTSSALQRILTKTLKIICFTVELHLVFFIIIFALWKLASPFDKVRKKNGVLSRSRDLFPLERIVNVLFVKHCVCFFFSFHIAVILEKTIRIPRSLSVKASSVLKGFLNKNPADRLGCRKETGFVDIVHHPFFKSVDWEMV